MPVCSRASLGREAASGTATLDNGGRKSWRALMTSRITMAMGFREDTNLRSDSSRTPSKRCHYPFFLMI